MPRLLGHTDLELMEALFESLPDSPFFMKDLQLRYVAANAAMANLGGVRRPSDLYGKTAGDVFTQSLARRYEAFDRLVLSTGRSVANKLDLVSRPSGGSAWLLFSRHPVRDGAGDIVGVAANSQRLRLTDGADITYGRLLGVLEHLDLHYDQPVRLVQLAALADVSTSQLERDFKRLFRVSIRDYLQKLRMERALELMETSASVASIAYACGYTDQSAFTRSFRRATGMAPRDYRRLIDAPAISASASIGANNIRISRSDAPKSPRR